MERFYNYWEATDRRAGDIALLGFLFVQVLDGVLTYFGVKAWGPGIEGNPIISSAMAHAGLGAGLAGAKLSAMALGAALHLRGVHAMVALLTAFYLVVAVLPWIALFCSAGL